MTEPSWIPEPGTSRTLEENWLFRLRRERFKSRNSGLSHDYFIMDLADAVNVIALTRDRRVILVRQFRAGSNSDSLEPPGGLLDAGEDPKEAGARELLEETGYAGGPAAILGSSWSNPSILGSRITTVLIEDAERLREPNLDESEEVSVELYLAGEILPMIRSGAIDHALAVGGLLLWWLGETIQSRALSTIQDGVALALTKPEAASEGNHWKDLRSELRACITRPENRPNGH